MFSRQKPFSSFQRSLLSVTKFQEYSFPYRWGIKDYAKIPNVLQCSDTTIGKAFRRRPSPRRMPRLLKLPLHQSCGSQQCISGDLKQALPSKCSKSSCLAETVELWELCSREERRKSRSTWSPRGVIKGQLEAAIAAGKTSHDRNTELLQSQLMPFFF